MKRAIEYRLARFTLVALASFLLGSAPGADVVESIVQTEMARQQIPGVAVGIRHKGQVVQARGYGLANLEWNAPVTEHTIFQSGSIGKQFTATAVMLLVEDLLKWDAALATGQLLKPSSFREMWTAVRLNDGQTYPYGFGWRVAQGAAGRELFHGGAWQGFQTDMARYVDADLTVIVLGNLAESDPGRIGRKIAEYYLPELVQPP